MSFTSIHNKRFCPRPSKPRWVRARRLALNIIPAHPRHSVVAGHVQTACWSPCSSVLLFTTTEEPFLFALNFHSANTENAVPVADLSHVLIGEDEQL